MNSELQKPNEVRPRSERPERFRAKVGHVVLVGLALASFGVGHQWSKSRPVSLLIPVQVAIPTEAPVPDTVPQEEESEVREAAQPASPRKVEKISRAATSALEQGQRSEAAPLSRQLVANLTQLEFSNGQLKQDQAAHWKDGLRQLIEQGETAVPAIQEFLERNRDWDFGAASPLGYPSLRTAFLDALEQIGGPEAQDLMLRTLQTTAVPAEIARAARFLEQSAPGQFLEEIRTAVRETLAQASADQLSGWDVGPLFQVLQSHGNESSVADLEKSASKWSCYSALTLANLPSGAGLPALVRLAQDSATARGPAVEALAQVAVSYPVASTALLELARGGKLSERNWISVTSALEGNQCSIQSNGLDNSAVPVGAGVKTYYLARSNQYLLRTPACGGMSIEQTQRRIAIIDQLLALNPSDAAAQALQQARASLVGSGQHASAN